MPTRFERWIRSKLAAITALTPSKRVPLAAQSRDEPVPYSVPARITSGDFVSAYFIAASKIDICSPSAPLEKYFVTPPSVPGTIRFLIRTLANVPRVMTRSFPRREPQLLKSAGPLPRGFQYSPAVARRFPPPGDARV